MKHSMFRRAIALLLVLCLLMGVAPAALAEEGGGGVTPPPPVSVPATGIALDQNTLTLEIPKTTQLVAVVSPTGSTDPIVWASDKTAVATVATDGTVTAVGPGQARITATAGAVSAYCVVTVPGLTLSATSLRLVTGNTDTIGMAVFGDAANQSYEWISSDGSVARVDQNGKVTALSPGMAKITVQSTSGAYLGSCDVTVVRNEAGLVRTSLSAGQVLNLGSLLNELRTTCQSLMGASLSYLTNLNISTSSGTLYYGYASTGDTGAGVGSAEQYYADGGGIGSRAISDVTYVPKSGVSGETTISYTGVTAGKQSFTGQILVTVAEVSGIRYTSDVGEAVVMKIADFSDYCLNLNGRDLNYIRFTPPAARYGTLYYNYTDKELYEREITAEDSFYRTRNPALTNVSFVPADGYTGTCTLSYTGMDTAGREFIGEVRITVSRSQGKTRLEYRTSPGARLGFDLADFSNACYEATDYQLDYVRFTLPASSQGVLYYNSSTRVNSGTNYYRNSSPYLENVSFLPEEDYQGTVTIPFTGYNTRGTGFSGTIVITVERGNTSLRYQTNSGSRVNFRAADFSDASYDATGVQLNYVRFSLPSSSQGTLYYNDNTHVSANTNYYRSTTPSLGNVSFVPKSDFTGTVTIRFTGYDTRGNSFSDVVTVEVKRGGNSDLSYKANSGVRLNFDVADFSSASYDATGLQLDYVRFTLPASSRGVLYYKEDTRLSAGTNYYRSGNSNRLLEDVSFVPESDFTGTATISFTGYDTRGNSFSGKVVVDVEKGGNSDVSYKGYAGLRLNFNAMDFSTASYNATGVQLDYVRFTLPASSRGVLYYKEDTRLSAGTNYYRSGNSNRLLEDVSFVPDRNFTGTTTISFTGYDTRGNSFSGKVTVTVVSPGSAEVQYSSGYAAISFQNGDFIDACAAALSGTLASVQFNQPDALVGQLYYGFTAPLRYESIASGRYYLSSAPYLNKLSFLPAAGFSGTVHLPFTAWNTKGESCSGTLRIQVAPSGRSLWFTDMGNHAWAVPAADFLYRYGVTKGTSAGKFSPGGVMRRGDFVAMLARTFAYPDAGKTSFKDVPTSSHYAAALASAKSLGIVSADASGNFRPKEAITRESAAIMLCLSMRAAGLSVPDGTREDLLTYGDRDQVSATAVGPLAALVKRGVFRGDASGNLKPKSVLSRGEMAVILHRAMS